MIKDKNIMHDIDSDTVENYTITPSRVVQFFRNFFLWQLVRFIVINLKMLRMISKSHSKEWKESKKD